MGVWWGVQALSTVGRMKLAGEGRGEGRGRKSEREEGGKEQCGVMRPRY